MALEHLKYQTAFDDLILIVVGPSGAGKSTLVKNINLLVPIYEISISDTSRLLTPGKEIEGEHYHSISREQFLEKAASDAYAETNAFMSEKLYGTPWSEFERALGLSKTPALDIDINGACQLVDKLFSRERIFLLFVDVDEDVQIERLITRDRDNEESIKKRVKFAHTERDHYHMLKNNDPMFFDHYINTSSIPQDILANEVLNLIMAKKKRTLE